MKFNEKLKLIECTESEKNIVEKVINDSTCIAVAVDQVKRLILQDKLIWNVGKRRWVDSRELNDMAYNIVQAIIHNYKYLTIVK